MAALDIITPSPTSINSLQAQVQGQVVLPGDASYDETRLAWNLAMQQYPAVIVVAESPADVMAAVQFARHAELGLAVQATGHGIKREANGCVLVITAKMTGVYIDPDTQSAWVEGGAMWKPVLEKAQQHGLAPLLGSSPFVGAVGYTLGGGMGWLARKYGLAVDSVLAFELVNANGELMRATKEENSELFWALRGSAGGFGVITGMQIQLYPVTEVYGGTLFYPIDQAKAVYTRYRSWIENAPEALTSSVGIINFPALPQLPEPIRGQSFVFVRGCYSENPADGEALFQQWRDWEAPALDAARRMPFSEVGSISSDPENPVPGVSSSAWVREISDEVIDIIIRYAHANNGFMFAEMRHAGAAISRVDAGANAYGNREAQHVLQLVGMAPTPEAKSAMEQYIQAFKQELSPYLTGGVYMNFLEGHESQARTKDAFTAENFRRLESYKAHFDPSNIFRFNLNIRPGAGA